MKKKIFCVTICFVLTFSTITQGAGQAVIPTELIEANLAENVLKSSVFPIDKTARRKIVRHHKKHSKLTKIEKYKNKLSNLGVVSSAQDAEFVQIKKEPEKKSKTVGYVPDEKAVTIIEQVEEWYKVKSGKITGYINQKHVIVDDKVEGLLLNNQGIEVTLTKENAALKSSAKDDGSTIGIAYKDNSYPVLRFSKDYKQVKIQRTETVSGWLPVKNVDIKILSEEAMTKSEYEEYLEEQERIRQAELQKILNMGISKTGDEVFDTITALIAHNESGNYMAARNGLPQFKGEKTITIGAWQWYGERAHNLLRRIYNSDVKTSKKLLRDALSGSNRKKDKIVETLCKEITGTSSWDNRKRSFSSDELVAIKALIGSDYGVALQNLQAKEDITARINVAKSTYKLTNPQLIAYFCDMFWQNPDNARAITKAAIAHFKSAEKLNKEKDGLKVMHEIAMKNSVLGKFSGRRNYTYSVCKKMRKK